MTKSPKAPDDVSQIPWEVDLDATDDFRWSYFSGLVFNSLALATRIEREEDAWLAIKQRVLDEIDAKKVLTADLLALKARIRDNLSFDTIKEHGGSTKDERLKYIQTVVAGNSGVLKLSAVVAKIEHLINDLELAAEKAEKTCARLDRVLCLFERIFGTLSTFAPESAAGHAALNHHIPVWETEVGQQVVQQLAPRLEDARSIPPIDADLVEGPPPGFVEESEIPF